MAHLTLAGVSDDGKRLLLVSDEGVEYTVDIEPRLRAALRGEQSRLGQLEIRMDSTLRPRDIQARIRAGETPEAVAEAAQTTVDRIMAFAAPVLAERQHIADRAQRSSVRRRTGDAGATTGARTLGDSVAGNLRALNVDPEIIEWDAWRREDGRWTLVGHYAATKRKGTASFTYDAPGNYVTADNDDARWLLGELAGAAADAPVRDDLSARRRRLSTVGEEELPLGDDAIELVSEPPAPLDGPPAPTTAPAAAPRPLVAAGEPIEAFLSEQPPADETALREDAAQAGAWDRAAIEIEADPTTDRPGDDTGGANDATEEPTVSEPSPGEPDDEAGEAPPPRRPVKKSRGRASVPSWDEIMFGGGKSD